MRKLVSLVLVLLLVSALFPAALASSASDADELKYPTCPVCKRALPDCVCGEKKPAPTATPAPHICSYGIYEYNGDGTHTAICSGAFFHRYVEKCYSDNNKNHKCDHCAGVMTEHEFSYTPCEPFSHKAVCYCGEEFIEPCRFADDKCEKCENICSIYTVDSKVLEELNAGGSSDSLSADGLRRDMFSIDYGAEENFRAEISQQALNTLRSENPDMGISVSNDSFSMMMSADFLGTLDEGAYVDSKSTEDGFALELGSGSTELVSLNTKGIASHWGTSSLLCRLDCAPSDELDGAVELLSVGLSSHEGGFASVSESQLEYEKELFKTRYRLNTVDYPYARTEFDRAYSLFSSLEQPQMNIGIASFDDWDAAEAYVLLNRDDRCQLAPDDEGCYEADVLLTPGREIEFGLIINHF
ncbi:MAG: hypothetical protein IJZ91_08485 [Oscillospiraceae bacterium]|nr:hypothetical protein [Oscillospiraceae bacterium]